MKRINKNLYPPGGYFFEDKDGTTLRASTWDALIKTVVKYRSANGFPEGDPWAEISAQTCERSPNICVEASPRPLYPKNKQAAPPSLKSRVIKWLAEITKARKEGHVELANRELARVRRTTCMNCPKKLSYQSGCAPCGAALKALRNSALGFDPDQPGAGGCNVLGADIATLANINQPTISNPELPDNCWLKRTL